MKLNDFIHKMNKELENFQAIHYQWHRDDPNLYPLDLPNKKEPELDWFGLFIDHWVAVTNEKVVENLIKKTKK